MRKIGGSGGEKKAFIWHAYRSWRIRILTGLSDFITDDVFASFAEVEPNNFIDDGCEAINAAVRASSGNKIDVESVLAERFPAIFPCVRAFHGCRGESSTYLEEGILRGDIDRSKAHACQLFGRPDRLDAIFDELQSYLIHNSGKVFFLLTGEEFLRNGTDGYIQRGSEFLSAVANRLGQEAVLASNGRGMIIECDIPTDLIPEEDVRGLTRLALTEVFRRFSKTDPVYSGDFGFAIHSDLPREQIVKIHFPLETDREERE